MASTPSALSIDLDVTTFKSLITDSSNDEITLILSGPRNFNGFVASLGNTSGNGVPTLNVTVIPEPATLGLVTAGLGLLWLRRRRRPV